MSRDDFHRLLQSQPQMYAAYEGTGLIEMPSGFTIPVDFELLQVEDGACAALCLIEEHETIRAFGFLAERPARLVGAAKDGRNVEFSGNLRSTKVSGSYVELHGQFISVSDGTGPTTADSKMRICATLTNVVCLEEENAQSTASRPAITIAADQRFHASVIARPNYQDSIMWLALFKGIRTTAVINIDVMSTADLVEIENYLQDLCILLSFAQGSRVAWIHYDLFDSEGRLVHSRHVDAITAQLVSLPVIPMRQLEVQRFLNECLEPYRRSHPTLDMKLVIDMIIAAKQEGNYLEARALQLVAAMEFIKGQVLRNKNMLTIVENSQFIAILDHLQERVDQAVTDLLPEISENEKEKLRNHVPGLNWYPFGAALKQVCAEYSVGLNSKERRRFVEIRNKLVHEYAFDPAYGGKTEQFFFLESFLSKIVLSVLKYQGHFYDWSYHTKDGHPRLLPLRTSPR